MQNWKSPWILKLLGNVLLSSLVPDASRLQLPALCDSCSFLLTALVTLVSMCGRRRTRHRDRAGRTPLADKKTVEKERETTQYDILLHIIITSRQLFHSSIQCRLILRIGYSYGNDQINFRVICVYVFHRAHLMRFICGSFRE